ncbi:MAG: hypothetical protein ACW98Y_19120 [Candidatus Thorarchaeota archaeon]|jgi:tetratricopeptide (TPR) repeat protein
MSEEEIRRMIEEATKEAMKQSFTEAGQKYLQAAKASERQGDFAKAEQLQQQAAENFRKAANEYRTAKSFKAAAINMCMAGDVYSELANAEHALIAYEQGATDLYGASAEHLMWGEDAETKKGTALAVTGSMILLMIGKDTDAFARARKYAAENASKLIFPGVVRLSQIPQMLESAINAMDISAFADAENAAVTELKAALAGANAQEFSGYVDKGIEMVREMLRGKLKVPKIASQLELPVDMTFKEEFPIKAIVSNTGDGPAKQVSVEWHIDEGLTIVSGETNASNPILNAGETWNLELTAKATADQMGSQEYEILLRGNYSDDLNTEYSLQAGPGTFVLKDFKETEKLLQDVDVTEGRVSLLYPSVDGSSYETEPLMRIVSSLESYLKTARTEIDAKDLNGAKARISVVNALVDIVDSLLGDESLKNQLAEKRESEKKAYTKDKMDTIKDSILRAFDDYTSRLKAENETALSSWDEEESGKKKIQDSLKASKEKVSDVLRQVEGAYDQAPQASATDNPDLAAKLSKTRTTLESLKSAIISLRYDIEAVAADSNLSAGMKPTEHPKIAKAKETLESLKRDVNQLLEE